MSMQTTSLPIQAAPSTPMPTQHLRAHATLPNDGVNFSATLQRQVDQRQADQRQQEQRQALAQPQPTPPAPPAAVPAAQAAARPAPGETRAPARDAASQSAKEAIKDTAHTAGEAQGPAQDATADTTGAVQGEAGAQAALPDASAADAVVAMLALVASFHQLQQVAASPAPAAAEAAATQPGTLFDVARGKPDDGALTGVQAEAAPEAAHTGEVRAGLEPAIDPRAPVQDKAADSAQLPVEASDFASRLRDTVALAAAREPAPAAEALRSLATQAGALQGAQASAAMPADRLSARVGSPAWDTQVGQKVIWMVGGADQSATLELNPPDLGPVQVVLNVSNDMASVTFSSQQLEVRQALENALPRLREMMSESGIALGNAQVNAGAEGRQGQDGKASGRPGSGRGGHDAGDSAVAEAAPRQRTSIIAGAVDTFA